MVAVTAMAERERDAAMDAGGDADADSGPLRTCVATGAILPPERMIRFVVGPDDAVVPDLAGKLPGRGMWVVASAAALAQAVARRAFTRAARRTVTVDDGLVERVERLLRDRAVEALALARRSGDAVCGFAKVEEKIAGGRLGLAVCAADARDSDGRAKLGRGGALVLDFVDADTLGRVFGRDDATYVGIMRGAMAARVRREIERWAAYRAAPAS